MMHVFVHRVVFNWHKHREFVHRFLDPGLTRTVPEASAVRKTPRALGAEGGMGGAGKGSPGPALIQTRGRTVQQGGCPLCRHPSCS